MARRYIGDANIYIQYHDDGDYRGSIVCYVNAQWPQFKERRVWKFRDLHAPAIGFGSGIAYDSPEAYDRMAQDAVSFGSYYTTMNRSEDDDLEGYPSGEVADAINDAVGIVLHDDGTYEVRRRK
jgi:hypothetical protein